MPDIVNLLPDNVANQIAAGEVIQRPASAVKEMLENAIDAKATNIRLIVKNAGKQLVQVIDNGTGMSETDARMCFEKHATSKIECIEDLFKIKTMGFRGEALASIGAVAQVELKTRKKGEELGVKINIEGSEVISQEACQCAEGTSLAAKNLFFNIPARRSFLKSNAAEMRHIVDEFQRVAIANSGIAFSLHHNDLEVFHLSPGNLKQRIAGIWKQNYNTKLVPVEEKTDVVNIKGFVGKIEAAKKTRGEQFFFVNNRFIKSPYLNHAVVNAYQGLLPADSFPSYFLFLEIDPAKIDVNVHPSKHEIKFEEDKIIYAFVSSAVKHALGQFSISAPMDFDQEGSFSNLESVKNPISIDNVKWGNATKNISSSTIHNPVRKPIQRDWQPLYEVAASNEAKKLQLDNIEKENPASKNIKIPLSGQINKPIQIHNKYILNQTEFGFILIDQQAAHERILYEQYQKTLEQNKSNTQKQLFTQNVSFSPNDADIVKELLGDIKILGFDIEEFGNNDFIINGIPADIAEKTDVNVQKLLDNIIEQFKQNKTDFKLDNRDNITRSLAKTTAIKSGKKLEANIMASLIEQLFVCSLPNNSPSGRPTMVVYKIEDIDKAFGK